MTIGTFVTDLFKRVETFFTSGKAEKTAQEVAQLAQLAAPIVHDLALMTPNKTVQEVDAAAQKYGVQIGQIASDPTAVGNALLNIATSVLQKNHAPTAAVSLLNTAVQMAVLATKG